MRAQISNRDYEQLSAYIDGQLAPAERRKLEERLREHNDLQAVLDEMSRTRALLRSAPRRRAPRNFTLTPAMVGSRATKQRSSWWNLFPVLSFTSAVATLALVASILFQLLPAQKSMQTAALQQPQQDRVADIVQQTWAAMQATAPASATSAPLQSNQNFGAGTGQPTKQEAQKQAAPAAGQPTQPVVGEAAPAAAATAAPAAPMLVEPTATPQQPQPESTAQGTPPVVAWGGNTSSAAGASGVVGGGAGPGGISGTLLGPPAGVTSSPPIAMGKGGGGGGGAEQPPMSQNIVIPQDSVNAPDTTPAAPSATEAAPAEAPAPAASNPAITGTGPILGVPPKSEGGQIVDKRAILGQPEASQPENKGPEQPRAGIQQNPPARPAQGEQPGLFGLNQSGMILVQALLALVAVAAGAAAFIVRRRARS